MMKPKVESSSKEQFILYVDSLPRCLKLLMKRFLFFFDVKIPNEIGALYYTQLLEKAQGINKRGWAALSFKYWDKNRDGVIGSEDIFSRFREFNNM